MTIDQAVDQALAEGWVLEHRTDTVASLVRWKRPSHVKHFIGFILTLGLWAIPWIIIAIKGGKPMRLTIALDADGQVTRTERRT